MPQVGVMRVLISSLNYAPEPTGIGPYAAGLAEDLQSRGHDVQVLTGIPHYPQWRNYTGVRRLRTRESINGVDVLRVGHYIPPGGIGIGRGLLELSFAAAAATAPWLHPDVIITVSPSLAATAALIARARVVARRTRIPVFVWVQDLYGTGLQELRSGSVLSKLARSLESAVLRNADGVVVIHERFGRVVRESYGVHPERTITLRNWTHVDFKGHETNTQGTRDKCGWAHGTIVLHAGNMGIKQGLDAVVAAARLAQEQESDVLFVLLGNGSERDRLMLESADCPNIQFLPTCPDPEFQAALEAADILLINELVGVREMALPSKLTTYFAAAKPVLAAVAGDGVTAEEINASRAGLVVRPGQPQDLLNAIARLQHNPDFARELARNGTRYAEENLVSKTVLQGFANLLMHTRVSAKPRRTRRAG